MRMGRFKDPLLHINLDNWIPDELHLMLRITDVMTRNLIIAAASDDLKAGRHSRDILNGLTSIESHEQLRSAFFNKRLRK